MSFLTLFIVSCLFYIVETTTTKQSPKITECGCYDTIDSFMKDTVFTLYSYGYNSLEYKDVFGPFKEDLLQAIEGKGLYSDVLESKLNNMQNEISAKASSETRISEFELKEILQNFVNNMNQFIKSPEFKTLGFKVKLDAFNADLKNVLENNGFKSENISEELDKFVDVFLKLSDPTEFDYPPMKQVRNELKEQLIKASSFDNFTIATLKDILAESNKNITNIIDDPEFIKSNMQYNLGTLNSKISSAMDSSLITLMDDFNVTNEEKEYYKGLIKAACSKYVNYMLFEMQQKGYKTSKPVITPIVPPQSDDDILVSFQKTYYDDGGDDDDGDDDDNDDDQKAQK
ncbi:hypothetical protein K1T71_006761 [Dendrolimus kikuchii]|uniref:Uncharacterized protein n=1 Tax=Dendrolimus kikuchii TaxID=765133 RepID=A0ACC1D1X9_9NEOP|nr:hypothetical protein K1T71_006761 [Dendrolimus kikuchii]